MKAKLLFYVNTGDFEKSPQISDKKGGFLEPASTMRVLKNPQPRRRVVQTAGSIVRNGDDDWHIAGPI